MSSQALTPTFQANWYVIHTKPRQERVALENLERQGYRCYLPMLQAQRIRRGKWQEIEECMFRRYLFIRLIAGQSNFAPIRNTRGVSGLVRFGVTPAIVPDEMVEALMALPAQETPLFANGDEVQISQGPFAGMLAQFVALERKSNGDVRALVMLEFLSSLQRITLPASALRRVA